ncbi:hypothetical protein B4Q13_24230, partial [Lacticaseibacillus rhamnosus]
MNHRVSGVAEEGFGFAGWSLGETAYVAGCVFDGGERSHNAGNGPDRDRDGALGAGRVGGLERDG